MLDTQINGITTKTPLQECEAHGFLYKYKTFYAPINKGTGVLTSRPARDTNKAVNSLMTYSGHFSVLTDWLG